MQSRGLGDVYKRQGMDRPAVRQIPGGSGEQRNMEETGCEVICGAPTIPTAKGWVKVKVNLDQELSSRHRITVQRASQPATLVLGTDDRLQRNDSQNTYLYNLHTP